VVGVILNLAVWFALHTLVGATAAVVAGPLRLVVPDLATVDLPAVAIFLAAVGALFRFHLGIARTLLLAVGMGVVLHLMIGT
jgi:chromate transporter